MISLKLSQGDTADFFRVDRGTVRAWSRKGLPHRPGGKGKDSVFHLSVCTWWRKGVNVANELREHPADALDTVALGFAAVSFSDAEPHAASASKTLAPYLEHKPADFLARVHYWRGFLTRARYQA